MLRRQRTKTEKTEGTGDRGQDRKEVILCTQRGELTVEEGRKGYCTVEEEEIMPSYERDEDDEVDDEVDEENEDSRCASQCDSPSCD